MGLRVLVLGVSGLGFAACPVWGFGSRKHLFRRKEVCMGLSLCWQIRLGEGGKLGSKIRG